MKSHRDDDDELADQSCELYWLGRGLFLTDSRETLFIVRLEFRLEFSTDLVRDRLKESSKVGVCLFSLNDPNTCFPSSLLSITYPSS
jgi:hypothetical protein